MLRALIRDFRRTEPNFNNFEKLSARIHNDYHHHLGSLRAEDATDAARLQQLRTLMRAEYSMRQRFIDLVDVDFADRPQPRQLAQRYRHMLRWMRADEPLDVFTLNNDLLMEWLLDQWRLPYADGFTPHGRMDREHWSCFQQDNLRLRLYKLHGSINWYRTDLSHPIEKRHSPNTLRGLLQRETAERPVLKVPLIWPGVYDEMPELGPWRNDYLAQAIAHARCLIIAGYKLADQEIRNIVLTSLRRWPPGSSRRVLIVCGDQAYDNVLQDFIDTARRETPAAVNGLQSVEFGCGFFPDVLACEAFCQEVDHALAGD